MKSFETGLIEKIKISHDLARSIHALGEFKGREELYTRQTPQILETLLQVAIIQSTESSNRIEGVTAPPKRIEALVTKKTTPKNRPEQEIAGYRDVLNTIHANHAHMPFTPRLVLQLHRDLFKYTNSPAGIWKSSDNIIAEKRGDSQFVRFKPVAAHQTAEYMDHLHDAFKNYWNEEKINKLFLIAAYILDFLCVHPFLDENGRMARLLTLLLYQGGCEVGRYISLEKLVENSRESYYDTLYQSSQGWHETKHDLIPWIQYFLGVLIAAYREFESRAGILTSSRGAKTQIVLDAVDKMPERFRLVELEQLCPNVSRDMIRAVLNRLRNEKKLTAGTGRGAIWQKRSNTKVETKG